MLDLSSQIGGLLYYPGDSDSNSLNPALNAAMLMRRYAGFATSDDKRNTYLSFAQSQLDYALGDNPMSGLYSWQPHEVFYLNPLQHLTWLVSIQTPQRILILLSQVAAPISATLTPRPLKRLTFFMALLLEDPTRTISSGTSEVTGFRARSACLVEPHINQWLTNILGRTRL